MIHCTVQIKHWPLKVPFRIAGADLFEVPVIVLELRDQHGHVGRAEAAGIDYDGETPATMKAQIDVIANALTDDIETETLLELLPRGGARNALDCALWDLRAKQTGFRAWIRAGSTGLQPLTTALTIGLGNDEETLTAARSAYGMPLLKIKVSATRHLAAIAMVRHENPGARLLIDANGSWSPALLQALMPMLQQYGVELIEQPFARGQDHLLDAVHSPIALAADESCTDAASLLALVGRYQYVNIKLDKCGGLTEALRMVEQAKALGLGLMVGNMCGSSLAMAPAFLIGQFCDYVDLDGPQLQTQDCAHPLQLLHQRLLPPTAELWG